jgi:hypothetical protein
MVIRLGIRIGRTLPLVSITTMTYQVILPIEQLIDWPEYNGLWANGSPNQAIKDISPLILNVEYSTTWANDYSRILTFESEEHYNWFLLKQ